MKLSSAIGITLASLIALGSSPARAVDCSVFFTFGAGVCGSVSVGGGAFNTPITPTASPQVEQVNGAAVTVGVTGAGLGGISASVSGTGTFGQVHLFATADNGSFSVPSSTQQGLASGNGIIGLVDGFHASASTIGHFQSTLEGAFGGAGEAQATLRLDDSTGGFFTALYSGTVNFTNKIVPSSTFLSDFQLTAGHDYLFLWYVTVFANSGNDDSTVLQTSTADVSHTGQLFIDADAPLTFLSGHNYSSPAAAAPLAGTLPLFATGLAGLGLLARRRRRQAA